MKTLLTLRHGQAERTSEAGDRGRALTEQGERDAADIGRQIRETFGCPALIVASDAVRARRTARIVAQALGYPGEVALRGTIYEAEAGDLLEVVQGLPEDAACVLLVGHNPGLEELAWALDADALAPTALPTSGLIPLHLDIAHWRDAQPGAGRAGGLMTPDHHHTDKGT